MREEFPINVGGPELSNTKHLFCPNCGQYQEVSSIDIYIPHQEVYSRNRVVMIEKRGPPNVKFELDCKKCNASLNIFGSDPI